MLVATASSLFIIYKYSAKKTVLMGYNSCFLPFNAHLALFVVCIISTMPILGFLRLLSNCKSIRGISLQLATASKQIP